VVIGSRLSLSAIGVSLSFFFGIIFGGVSGYWRLG
jgi:hypothetical protein